jgi:hypothetical protein
MKKLNASAVTAIVSVFVTMMVGSLTWGDGTAQDDAQEPPLQLIANTQKGALSNPCKDPLPEVLTQDIE